MVIGCTRSKETVLREEVSQHLVAEVPLTGQLEHTGRDQLPQQLQQITGEKTVVPWHQKSPNGVTSENLPGLSVQLFHVNRLADKPRVLLQHPGHDVRPASFWLAQAPAKVFLLVCFIGTEVIVGRLGGLGQPLPGIVLRAVVPALR